MITKYTFAFLSLHIVFLATAGQNTTKIIQVHVLFRHGARAPSYYYPTDPNKNTTPSFYPEGFGGLTNEGKLAVFKLGQHLRQLYGTLLGDVYEETSIKIRSTDYGRTKMCAELVAAGLFPPSKIQLWNGNLPWQPIPYDYKSLDEEDIFHPWTCQYKLQTINNLTSIPDVQRKYIQPNSLTYSAIEKNCGLPMTNPADLLEIYSILLAEQQLNLTHPVWVKTFFPEPIQTLAGAVYAYNNYNQRLRQINSGYMLQNILNDTRALIANPKGTKMFLYSGHEETVGSMINALGVYKDHVPYYTSALIFEVHQRGINENFIKVKFRNGTVPNDVIDLVVPNCDSLCPLSKFEELQKQLLPTVSISEACKL